MSIFGALENLRTRPIGGQEAPRAARVDFRRRIAIDTGHPLYNEAVCDARDLGIAGENFYAMERNPPYWRRIDGATEHLYVRRSIGEKLRAVNERAASVGLELFLYDTWRPRAVQAYFHDVWMPDELRRRDPSLSGAALTEEVERYWAAPSSDAKSPAPHATGGAVDLTLRWKEGGRWKGGETLWMGSLFDDVTALANRDFFELVARPDGEPAPTSPGRRSREFSFSDEEARANRRLLHGLMVEEGFAGHPDEWWHFSWGDQLWAALTGAPAAHYGLAAVPD